MAAATIALCALALGPLMGVTTAAGAGPPPPTKPAPGPAQVVVKIDRADGYTIGNIEKQFPVHLVQALLGTRGIYLVESTSSPTTSIARPYEVPSMCAYRVMRGYLEG